VLWFMVILKKVPNGVNFVRSVGVFFDARFLVNEIKLRLFVKDS
jgi:hypothetical protein